MHRLSISAFTLLVREPVHNSICLAEISQLRVAVELQAHWFRSLELTLQLALEFSAKFTTLWFVYSLANCDGANNNHFCVAKYAIPGPRILTR